MDDRISLETLKKEAEDLEKLILASVDMEDAGFYSTISTPLARLMSHIKKSGHMESRNEIMGSELIRAWTQEYWGYRKYPAQPPSRAWLEPFLKLRQNKAV
ncbi:hypothetical protein EST38_g14409 [Candolleomyces aberdarensis]|uniref:Uncharacterized protein n=1 Tax=Candolleomyces aberdarensis TaxID=2316362 RepID=A0A4Q2CXC6_9AGAR|nr:hypothetical protein EST38_g14409 [Candolleomyces aberdarensis]